MDKEKKVNFELEKLRGEIVLLSQSNETNLENMKTDLNLFNKDKADKDFSNVTFPEIVASGTVKKGVADRVVESYISSDKKTWYKIWASGLKECGQTLNFDGQVNSSGTSTRTVTLPLNIENILFAVCNTNINTAGVSDGSVFINIGEYAVQNGNKTAKLYIRNTATSSSAKNVILSYYCYGY